MIFGIDEGPPEVRLNEEVKAVAIVTAARAIDKGQDVTEDDIAGYKDILLTEEDPDAGHITIVAHKGGWALAFDFRRNASRIAEHSEVARQFLEAAEWAREQGYERVFADTLFSATELMAKGMLIWQPDRSLLDSKTHRYLNGPAPGVARRVAPPLRLRNRLLKRFPGDSDDFRAQPALPHCPEADRSGQWKPLHDSGQGSRSGLAR